MPVPLATLAATLLLFVLGFGGLFYLTRDRDDDEPTAPAAAQATDTAVVTATVDDSVVPEVISSPGAHTIESISVFAKFREPSSVGPETPVSERYRLREVDIAWDGTGIVMLSGCPDRLCDMIIDDELHVRVTNSAGQQKPYFIQNNRVESRTMPVSLNTRLIKGDNVVAIALWDKQGDRRGALTPIYILIFR